MSRLIIGFSPTVFASGSRTAIFFYIVIIMLTLFLITELYNENKINENYEHLIKIIFVIFTIIISLITFIFTLLVR